MNQLLREENRIGEYLRAQELSSTVCIIFHQHLPAFFTRRSLFGIFFQSLTKWLNVSLYNLIWSDFEKPESYLELIPISNCL
jgi:hypothetical protein